MLALPYLVESGIVLVTGNAVEGVNLPSLATQEMTSV
jgi:hypothetical protein